MKVLKFEQSEEYFFQLACDCSDNGDFVSSLDYLHRAVNMADDNCKKEDKKLGYVSIESYDEWVSIQAEIAATYCEMGLYEDSIKEYYKMYKCSDEFKDELFFGLVKNYAMLDMVSQAAYYLKYGINHGYLDPGEGMTKEDLLGGMTDNEEPFSIVPKDDSDYAINLARQLLATSEDNKYAKQILQGIQESSKYYRDALGMLAVLALGENNIEETLEYADKALQINQEDVNALCVKAVAYNTSNQSDGLKKTLDTLDALGVTNLEDSARIATAMANVDNNALALKYANICLGYMPYDREMCFIKAVALSNLGKKQESKAEFVRLQIIYPDDIELKMYARKVDAATTSTDFYLFGMAMTPESEIILDEVDTFFAKSSRINAIIKEIDSNPDIMEKIQYVFQAEDLDLINSVGSVLAQTGHFDNFLRYKLVDPSFPLVCKKELLCNILIFGGSHDFFIVSNNIIHEFKPRIPREISMSGATRAYWQVYSALALVETDFDKKLNSACRSLCKKCEVILRLDTPIVAAIIAFKSKCSKIFSQKEYCAEIFGCDIKTLNFALEEVKRRSTK